MGEENDSWDQTHRFVVLSLTFVVNFGCFGDTAGKRNCGIQYVFLENEGKPEISENPSLPHHWY